MGTKHYTFYFPSDTNTQLFIDEAEKLGVDLQSERAVFIHAYSNDPLLLEAAKELGATVHEEDV